MEPELCAAVHHVIHNFDEDCFSKTSLGFLDFLENEFQDRVLEKPVVGRDQGFDVDQGLHDEVRRCHFSCLQKQRQQPSK